ncbi:MAG TPA: TolC family protein [Chryseosolibacter sp.]
MRKLLLFLLLTNGLVTVAQVQFSSLNDVITHAKANNPALKAEDLNQQVSDQRLKTAWSALLPTVRAFGTLDNNISLPVQLVPAEFLGGPEGEFAKVQFGTQFASTYGAEANLTLVNASNWKNIKASSLAKESSRYQYLDRELSLTEQVIAAYYFALLSRESIILNEELLDAADSLLSAASVRLQNGMIEPLEFNRVKSLFLETETQLRESEGAYQKNLNTLKALINIAGKDSLILTESIASTISRTQPSSLAISFSQLPRYRMLNSRYQQSAEDLKRQQLRVLPELSVYGRYTRQAFNNEFEIFSSSQSWFDVGVIGLRAEWNIFSGFARQSSIRQASLQSRSAQLELENYTRQSEKELEELAINHRVAAEGLAKFTEHFELNAANHRIAGDKYTEGIYTIDQYVTIYQERVRSQNQYLSKLASFLIYESMIQSRNLLK